MIPSVDPSLWTLYNEDPTNFLIYGVAADQARDNGNTHVAEFFDWCYINKLAPNVDEWSFIDEPIWGWYGVWSKFSKHLQRHILKYIDHFNRSSAYEQLARLFDAYTSCILEHGTSSIKIK